MRPARSPAPPGRVEKGKRVEKVLTLVISFLANFLAIT